MVHQCSPCSSDWEGSCLVEEGNSSGDTDWDNREEAGSSSGNSEEGSSGEDSFEEDIDYILESYSSC